MDPSSNPNTTDHRAQVETTADADDGGVSSATETTGDSEHRRNFLVAFAASVIGLVLAIFPLAAGALVVLDPLLGKKKRRGKFVHVATLAGIPADGTPVQVPVVADSVDAWNREPNQPIGAVYLRRSGDRVTAFNAICPHAGCFINYAKANLFQCPCHTSSFSLEGRRMGENSPSPRDMDELKVDQQRLASDGEVWVEFVNYYTGKEERIPKA